MKSLSPHARTGLVLLLLLALAVGFLWKVVLLGRILLPGDVLLLMVPWRDYARERFPDFHEAQNGMFDPLQQYYPWRLYAVNSLKEGVFPLWNPYMLCGTPFLANLLSAVLYPPNLLFLLMPVEKGFGYAALLHLTAVGWGMFFFLRQIGLGRGPAAVGAGAFMFNGFFIAWLEFPNVSLWVGAWLPWILFLWERAWQRKSIGWLCAAGGVLGLQFTGGHMQISFYVVLGFLLYALFRLCGGGAASPGLHLPGVSARLRYLLLPLGIAGLLAAPQLLPSFEMAQHSDRQKVPWSMIRDNALPPAQLLTTFLLPNLFGNSRFHNLYWGRFNFIEMCGYVGVTTFIGALSTLVLFRGAPPEQRRYAGFFWGLVGLSLLMALATPVYSLFYHFLPGFRQLSAPARILYLNAFACASLAALGTAWLGREWGEAERRIIPLFLRAVLGILALTIVLSMRSFADFFGEELVRDFELKWVGIAALWVVLTVAWIGLRTRLRPLPWTGGLGALILLDLFSFGAGFNPTVPREMLFFETPLLRYLQEHLGPQRMATVTAVDSRTGLDWMPPNTQMVYGLRSIQGSDSLTLAQYTRLLRAFTPDAREPHWANLDQPFVDLFGVRYILTPREHLPDRFRRVLTDRRTHLYENPQAFPRAFALPGSRILPNLKAVRTAMTAPGFDPREAVLLEGEGGGGKRREGEEELQAALSRPVAFSLMEDAPNRVTLQGAVLSTGGDASWVLVLSDTYYPGWQAYVDGQRQPILRAYGTLRAVRLDEGEHEVRFVYRPLSFQAGMFMSLVAWSGLVAAGMVRVRGKRRGGEKRKTQP